MESALLIGWTTVDSESAARALAQAMIEQQLAVCVQIDAGVQSFYRWKGEVNSECEWRLTVKFLEAQSDRLLAYIQANHPYDIPEWIVVSADQVATDYLDWAVGQINDSLST